MTEDNRQEVIKKNQWKQIPTEEKEVTIIIDYFEKTIQIYTSNQATSNKLLKKIGEPKTRLFTEGKISGMEWELGFNEREKIRKGLSISNYISSYLSELCE